MSVEPPGKGWNVLGAMFMGCGGVLLIALGGTCSYVVGAEALGGGSNGIWPLLLLSLAILGGGIVLIVQAIRLLRE